MRCAKSPPSIRGWREKPEETSCCACVRHKILVCLSSAEKNKRKLPTCLYLTKNNHLRNRRLRRAGEVFPRPDATRLKDAILFQHRMLNYGGCARMDFANAESCPLELRKSSAMPAYCGRGTRPNACFRLWWSLAWSSRVISPHADGLRVLDYATRWSFCSLAWCHAGLHPDYARWIGGRDKYAIQNDCSNWAGL